VFFDTVSGFQEIGSISKNIYQRYSVIFPLLSFLVLCLIYIAKQTTRFVNNYEH
jgi:hypothetical protein